MAQSGITWKCRYLSDAYARGNGVPLDRERAYAMLQRARSTGPDGMAVDWYEQIDNQEAALLTLGLGQFTLTERAEQLEHEGKVDAALVETTEH